MSQPFNAMTGLILVEADVSGPDGSVLTGKNHPAARRPGVVQKWAKAHRSGAWVIPAV
jgi:hypothetical protein